jgi:hypothetical protein
MIKIWAMTIADFVYNKRYEPKGPAFDNSRYIVTPAMTGGSPAKVEIKGRSRFAIFL